MHLWLVITFCILHSLRRSKGLLVDGFLSVFVKSISVLKSPIITTFPLWQTQFMIFMKFLMRDLFVGK